VCQDLHRAFQRTAFNVDKWHLVQDGQYLQICFPVQTHGLQSVNLTIGSRFSSNTSAARGLLGDVRWTRRRPSLHSLHLFETLEMCGGFRTFLVGALQHRFFQRF
jgi:hypothetical protein